MVFDESVTREPGTETDVVLELSEIRKSFDGVEAVRGVNLKVRHGEVVTLLGPSGCGKTTTLRMVLGLERCTSGRIVYRGEVLDGDGVRAPVPVHKRNMGFVFQNYAIWPHMTALENVAYPLRVRRVPRREMRDAVDRVVELVGLSGFASRAATKLSGGQQQRVALARALVFEPELLLLDEPFSNLDARLREDMRSELKLLQQRLGVTVLFVTHDQHEALSMSDRIAVMSHGKVEQLAAPEEIYREPATKHVRDFLGRTNTLNGRVDAIDGPATTLVRLDIGGDCSRVRARPQPGFTPKTGDGCEISIRPEHVRLSTARPARADSNEMPGTLRALLFLGDRYEAVVEIGAGQRLLSYLPTASDMTVGSAVLVELPEKHLTAWPQAEPS